ncbi:venom allergen 5 2-like [Macrosteles quadrilineatus]|uniref:venom allergen 5 2-like n=1 Tax=Macrosteles quadrilineatus TaxID=74068 RepID=UPI0023E288F0|nr:venom allergen 5 2-like [Macrosteles quadrilineatus]
MFSTRFLLAMILFRLITPNQALITLDYCLLSCGDVNHTMCDYLPGGGPECGEFQGGLSEEEEKLIVDLHNRHRQKIASGDHDQPHAADMLEVIWDREAAIIAQRWADQCDVLGHDKCRRTLHAKHVGQNTAWMKGVDYPGRRRNRADVIEYFITGWFNEVENYPGDVDGFNPTDQELPKFAHYTQLVWGSTAELGCGFVQWVTDIEYEYKLVCNYVPGGNLRGVRVYRRGEPCSGCPLFTKCSETYPGLCAAHDWSRIGDVKTVDTEEKQKDIIDQREECDKEDKDEDEEIEEEEEAIESPIEDTIHPMGSDVSVGEEETIENDSGGHGHALRRLKAVRYSVTA